MLVDQLFGIPISRVKLNQFVLKIDPMSSKSFIPRMYRPIAPINH